MIASHHGPQSPRSCWRRWEAPTWALAAAVYGGWLALTLAHHTLPAWVVVPLGGWLVAWHGSLQHEAIHGHPTRRPWLDALVAGWPLGLWLPFATYRDSHLAHHRDPILTDPFDDPESWYVDAPTWGRLPATVRALLWAQQTLLGRMLLGPPRVVAQLATAESRRLLRGDARAWRNWAWHLPAAAAVLLWVTGVCGVPIGEYALMYVYPGMALTLVRSFAEHRPAAVPSHRTAVTEGGLLLPVLFLHNNLHAVHHRWPRVPWYELPARYRRHRAELLRRNDGFLYRGYLEQLRRFGLRPKDAPVHPRGGELACAPAAAERAEEVIR